MKKLKTLNMCDFCSKEIQTCGANTVLAKEVDTDDVALTNPDSIIACDQYENPVDILKKKFH
ncbi:MAG: hypothetical protein NPINA01_15540 [Nitrospinaceae bacterium]|nr:MAG: hypothetical protein NPINA01_15540 [Nitrospinaceae bacterium]